MFLTIWDVSHWWVFNVGLVGHEINSVAQILF
jgi:hypothetical protein